jgi:hypothetical protein
VKIGDALTELDVELRTLPVIVHRSRATVDAEEAHYGEGPFSVVRRRENLNQTFPSRSHPGCLSSDDPVLSMCANRICPRPCYNC